MSIRLVSDDRERVLPVRLMATVDSDQTLSDDVGVSWLKRASEDYTYARIADAVIVVTRSTYQQLPDWIKRDYNRRIVVISRHRPAFQHPHTDGSVWSLVWPDADVEMSPHETHDLCVPELALTVVAVDLESALQQLVTVDPSMASGMRDLGSIVLLGGPTLYEQYASQVDTVYLTMIHASLNGRVSLPDLIHEDYLDMSSKRIVSKDLWNGYEVTTHRYRTKNPR